MKTDSRKWSKQGRWIVALIGFALFGGAIFWSCKVSREQAAIARNTLYAIELQLAAFNAPQNYLEWR